MRWWLVVALVACRSKEPEPAPAAVPGKPHDAGVVVPRVADARPRGGDEVDGSGVGRLSLGTPASELPGLGFAIASAQGSGSFTQDGQKLGTMRFGFHATLQRDGVDQLEVEVEPARETVEHIRVIGPLAKTFEGIAVGDSRDKLAAVYGAPEDTYERFGHGSCEQFARRPGVDFCFGFDGVLAEMMIPALHRSPLDLGEDLAAIRKTLDGHVLGGNVLHGEQLGDSEAKLVAPCVLAIHRGDGTGWWSVVAHDGAVYSSAGGWRRKDGSIVICDQDVFEIAPTGEAKRWYIESLEDRWAAQPAACTVAESSIACRGVTQMTDGFRGTFVGDLVVRDSDRYAEERALAPGAPLDDCDRIALRSFAALAPAFALLGSKVDPAAYLDSGTVHRFIGTCEAAPAQDRACLLHAQDILHAPQAEKCQLDPPYLDDAFIPEPELPALSASEQRARAAAVVGTWQRIGSKHAPDATWVFTRSGHILMDGSDEGRYSFPRAGAIHFDTMRDDIMSPFARAGARNFYAYDSGVHCGSHVKLRQGDLLVLPDCKVVSPFGAISDATCSRTPSSFELHYTDRRGDAQLESWRLIDGCFVDPESAPFVRRQ